MIWKFASIMSENQPFYEVIYCTNYEYYCSDNNFLSEGQAGKMAAFVRSVFRVYFYIRNCVTL